MLSDARGGIWTRTPNKGKGILSPSFEEVSPEQTATKGPTHSAYVHGSAWASQSALPRTLPRANGLQVPDTARTYSSDLVPTECERPRGLSVHVPKRPTRNAPGCQIHVREFVTSQR